MSRRQAPETLNMPAQNMPHSDEGAKALAEERRVKHADLLQLQWLWLWDSQKQLSEQQLREHEAPSMTLQLESTGRDEEVMKAIIHRITYTGPGNESHSPTATDSHLQPPLHLQRGSRRQTQRSGTIRGAKLARTDELAAKYTHSMHT